MTHSRRLKRKCDMVIMNDIHDMARIGDAGSKAYGRGSYGTGGDSADRYSTDEQVKEWPENTVHTNGYL